MNSKKKYLVYIPQAIVAIVLVAIQVFCDLKLPEYLITIVNDGVMKGDLSMVLGPGAEMLGFTLIGMVTAITVSYFASRISSGVSRDLRNDIFEKIEGFSMHEFDKFSTASLITRSTNDIQQIQMFTFMLIRMMTMAPIMAVGGIIKAIETSKSISWILAVAVPITLTFIFIMMIFIIPVFNKIQNYTDGLNKVSRESLTGIRVIRAFRREKTEEKKFDNVNSDLTKINIFMNRMMSLLFPVTMFFISLTQLAIVWFGAKAIDAGDLEIGNISGFTTYAIQVLMSFLMLTMMSVIFPRAMVSWKRIHAVLKTNPSIISKPSMDSALTDLPAQVVFQNVSFAYPGASEKVLSDISFTAKKGEITAFIGSTGCGKSTLVNLIPRFYDVTEGEVLVNGVSIKEIPLDKLHDVIGYVPQKSVLFKGTIESNIKQGKLDASPEEIELSAKIAQAENFILEKEEKYNSEISQSGTNVSGGQKQRLSIARALVRKPQIYIFDDSFSALDFKTDRALREALKPYIYESVAIIVAQRISTIMYADRIIVLDEGKIVGTGKHRELLENCQVYKEIASSQLSKEELA